MTEDLKRFFVPFEICIDPHYPVPPYRGQRWTIVPANLRASKASLPHFGLYCKRGKPSKHVVIHAVNLKKAIDIAQLIHACCSVIDAGSFWFDVETMTSAVQEIEADFGVTPDKHCHSSSTIQQALSMTTRAEGQNRYQYAIYHLFNSYRLFSLHWIQTDPYHSKNLPKPSLKNVDPVLTRVTYAHAISLAYQAIEELVGPASRSPGGLIAEDTKERLIHSFEKNRIKYPSTFVWLLRGPKTFLERGRTTVSRGSVRWAKLPQVRDQQVDLIDAICDASFLRNRVTAHKLSSKDFHKRVKTISVYDVFNVQILARRLIVEAVKAPIFPRKRPYQIKD